MASNAKNLAELLNQDSTVAVGDIADGSVTTAKLAADAVTAAKLADNAVVTANISAGTLEGSGVNLGRRNLIINGAMRIAQRGTSATGVTNNGGHFLVDRFKTVINNAFTSTIQQVEDVPDGQGFKYSLKHTFTTAKSSPSAGDYNVLDQNLEKQNIYSTENGTSSAKSITLSFWVKSSVTGTFAVALQNYGSSRRSNVLSYTISSANTWEKKVITTTADPSANTQSANGAGLGLRFALSSGSNYEASNATTGWQTADYFGFNGATYPAGTTNATWQITGIQLEVGSSASDFEHLSYAEELLLCQRYYQQSYDDNTVPGTATNAGCMIARASGGDVYLVQLIRRNIVTMRTTPSAVSYSPNTGAADKVRISSGDQTVSGVFDAGRNSSGFPLTSGSVSDGNDVRWHFTLSSEL